MIRRPTWILLGVFGLALGIAWYFQRLPNDSGGDATPTEGVTFLFATQANPIVTLRISDSVGNVVSVNKDVEGNWSLIEPESSEADQGRIEAAVMQAEGLRILSTLEAQPDLKVIGLDPPVYRLQVTLEDGQHQNAFIGDLTPTGSGYYGHLDGGQLQVLNKFNVDAILEILDEPPLAPTPTPPTPSPEADATETTEP